MLLTFANRPLSLHTQCNGKVSLASYISRRSQANLYLTTDLQKVQSPFLNECTSKYDDKMKERRHLATYPPFLNTVVLSCVVPKDPRNQDNFRVREETGCGIFNASGGMQRNYLYYLSLSNVHKIVAIILLLNPWVQGTVRLIPQISIYKLK